MLSFLTGTTHIAGFENEILQIDFILRLPVFAACAGLLKNFFDCKLQVDYLLISYVCTPYTNKI